MDQAKEIFLQIERLNKLMEQKGWGPIELERASGVGYDTIYKIRTAKRPKSSAEILGRLCQALGCSLDYIMGMTDDPRPYPDLELSMMSQELLYTISRLSPRRQHDLLIMVRALAEDEDGDAHDHDQAGRDDG
jgi:DNA-binding Xre family transcriptional regulator